MVLAIYTTGPVNNQSLTTHADSVSFTVLNRNTTGNASVTIRVIDIVGTRTLIPGGQLVVNVPPNSGANTASVNTEASGAFEVIIIIDHPTNVNNVEVSVWGSDDTGFLAQFRFAYEEMHRIV